METPLRLDGVFGEVERADEPLLILPVRGVQIELSQPNEAKRQNDAAENEKAFQ
jgi:hypothetical protein